MESFYSIIYYKTNPLTDELVSIGILAGGGEGPFMFVSDARLDLLKKTLHPNTFLSVRRHLKFLLEKVNKHRNEDAGILLFDPIFSVEQMESLAKKTKGAMVYSQPTTINEWLDEKFFKNLSNAFFGENIKSKSKKKKVFHLKWKAFYNSTKFLDWERDIAISNLIDSSPLNIKIDLVNLSKKEVIKGIDFDLSETSLNRKLYELELIANALPDYKIKVVYPTPKKNTGKSAFDTLQKKEIALQFEKFSELKKMN